jgi:formimidoylglutamate deiminase
MHLIADWALLEDGFAPNVHITVANGLLTAVSREPLPGAEHAERLPGVTLPGMPNLHSHAFQRVFAGLTAHTGGGGDFWAWRTSMYRAAAQITPELYAPITAYLAKELLKGGYTSLAEFHYVQRTPEGTLYPNRTEMAEAIFQGAAQAGIGLTLLVGLYETAGLDAAPLAPTQRRFLSTAEDALATAAQLQSAHPGAVGLALHSLRAVPAATLATALPAFTTALPHAPIHIHVAEQQAEVQACIETLGAPPIAWLLQNAPVGPHWCLVHATHATPTELRQAAATGAIAGLCPSTEADLGDGIFNLPTWQDAKGRYGIGSDSNILLSAPGELRLLEWGQRLNLQRRNITATPGIPCGRNLWQHAAQGGAQACGLHAGTLTQGHRADLVVLNTTPESAALAPDFVLDAAIFAAPNPIRHVMANGLWQVRDGRHRNETEIDARYAAALQALS